MPFGWVSFLANRLVITDPYDESKVVGARNFCNKLWNIARFIQEQLDTDGAGNLDNPKPQSIADHWMLTNLQQLTDKIAKLLEDYRFSEAYDQIYHFVWDDFADWYIEASKTAPNYALLKFGLESILKLCHPFAPFVTEAIWTELDWKKDQSDLLITSAWPTIPTSDKTESAKFEDIKNIVTEIRQLSKAMGLSKPDLLHKSSGSLADDLQQGLVIRLARLNQIHATDKGRGYQLKNTKQSLWLDISDDTLANYRKQLQAILEELQSLAKNYQARLANKGYIANAPEKVVGDTRNLLTEAESKIELIQVDIKRLG
jgi:valyl-tRNA synthetase